MADLLQHVRGSGFCFPDRLIHLFVGGSELHGAKVDGTDDLDISGVFVEPSEMVLGLKSMPHLVWSTAGNDRRTGIYSVDKVLAMAQKLFFECAEAARLSSLPEKVDRAAGSRLLADCYREVWMREPAL